MSLLFHVNVGLYQLKAPLSLERGSRKMGSRCTRRSRDFQAGLKWTEEILPALFWTAVGRSLARCYISVGSGVKTQQVKEGKTVPILMMGWASGKLSHGPGTFFSQPNYPNLLISWLFGMCVGGVQMSRCFCPLSDQQSAIRPQGTTCSLWLGAISHLNNDICHHFCNSSCPSSYLQTILNMSAWVSANRPAQF